MVRQVSVSDTIIISIGTLIDIISLVIRGLPAPLAYLCGRCYGIAIHLRIPIVGLIWV